MKTNVFFSSLFSFSSPSPVLYSFARCRERKQPKLSLSFCARLPFCAPRKPRAPVDYQAAETEHGCHILFSLHIPWQTVGYTAAKHLCRRPPLSHIVGVIVWGQTSAWFSHRSTGLVPLLFPAAVQMCRLPQVVLERFSWKEKHISIRGERYF